MQTMENLVTVKTGNTVFKPEYKDAKVAQATAEKNGKELKQFQILGLDPRDVRFGFIKLLQEVPPPVVEQNEKN